jgi:hypothetical protein
MPAEQSGGLYIQERTEADAEPSIPHTPGAEALPRQPQPKWLLVLGPTVY